MNAPGLERVRNISVMGDAGDGYASHAELRFTGVRVPVTNRIGAEGAGFALAQERLGPGRIHHCMRWIGICERAFRMMCERAATRELSPGHALGEQQTVQHWIAESRAEIDAARLLVLDTAQQIESNGAHAARDRISLIKFHVAGVLQRVLDRALQTHGALGMTDDTPLAWWYRHERGARIYDGPDEVHKSAVARAHPQGIRPEGIVSETLPVRAGEELDLRALNEWLAARAPVIGAVSRVEQFSGGFSNLTYLLKSGHGEFVLRRPPAGVGKGSAHDVAREYRILAAVAHAIDSRASRDCAMRRRVGARRSVLRDGARCAASSCNAALK